MLERWTEIESGDVSALPGPGNLLSDIKNTGDRTRVCKNPAQVNAAMNE